MQEKRKTKSTPTGDVFTIVVGITAEYNPFHAGHARQLASIRAEYGENTPVVAVLSGDFVQRGEAACFSKFARAEAAVRSGVSLVLELPLPWCLASAEGFARGAVGMMKASGVIDIISFGSESADLAAMKECAEALSGEAFHKHLREHLNEGSSFAVARERALVDITSIQTASCLRQPNDLLAVEYIRAAGNAMEFFPVMRAGPAHDGPGSASDLRSQMAAGEDWLSAVSRPAREVFARETAALRGPITEEKLRLAILSRLRERTLEDFAAVPDAAEGLEHKLYKAARELPSGGEIAAAAKSKRYALSRLRRMVMCAALGVQKGMADGVPPFLRVLAMDDKGMALLRRMRKTASLPLLTKSAHIRRLDARAQAVFELGSRAHDLYVLGYGDAAAQRGGEDYRAVPFILQNDEEDICIRS